MEREDADPTQLLNLAQTHLRLRNYTLSQQYSLELLSSSTHLRRSHHLFATQTLTLSATLSATTNHYSVLQIDYFSDNRNLIGTNFKNILSILDPIKHSSSLAQQAIDLVHKAYNCLSDPAKKAVYDAQFRSEFRSELVGGDGNVSSGGVFWTFCPYCYYVYEYDKVYQGCCLRCQNLGCRRVFHGVSVGNLAKMELDKGRNIGCFGYFPLGVSVSKEGDKFDSWSPFVGMVVDNARNSHVNGTTNESDKSDKFPHNVVIDLEENDPGVDFEVGVGVGGGGGIVGDMNEADMTFFEEGTEIYVDLGDEDDAM